MRKIIVSGLLVFASLSANATSSWIEISPNMMIRPAGETGNEGFWIRNDSKNLKDGYVGSWSLMVVDCIAQTTRLVATRKFLKDNSFRDFIEVEPIHRVKPRTNGAIILELVCGGPSI